MKYDCGISKGKKRFRYRTGGIIVNDGKMLFVKSGEADYYYMIGGAVCMGETSEKCIEREIFEETGMNARACRLAVVCENFFKGTDGFDCHTLEFYYHMRLESGEIKNCKSETDIGEKLVWLPIEEIRANKIKPVCMKERIYEILNATSIIHIVNDSDKSGFVEGMK